MRRTIATLLCTTLMACSGDTPPLPPLSVGPQWMPLTLDTTGNLVMRRMALWVDTAHVTISAAGYAVAAQKMHVDMKIGGMSTGMQMRTEFDCTGKRYRVMGIDSMTAMVKGTALPDSLARKAMAQQSAKANDTTWRTSADGDPMLTAVCAKLQGKAATP